MREPKARRGFFRPYGPAARIAAFVAVFSLAVGNLSILTPDTAIAATWSPQTNPTVSSMNDIYFIDATTGYSVGMGGTGIKTVDGSTWTTMPMGTGADLYACIGAALATLSGPRHGGAADRIEALIDEVARPERAQRVVHERARRGDAIEGFGHPLYPKGDPRGAALLALAEEIAPDDLSVRISRELVEAMHGSGGTLSVDLGLVALCEALGLARGSAAGLFAVARCAGWVAHCLEQYEAGFLLRPRARYLERD